MHYTWSILQLQQLFDYLVSFKEFSNAWKSMAFCNLLSIYHFNKKKSRESNTFWLRRKLIPYLEKRTSHFFTIALVYNPKNKVFWLHALIEFVLIGIAYILWGVPNKKLTVHKLRTNGIDLHRIRTNRNWIATNMVPKNMNFKSS